MVTNKITKRKLDNYLEHGQKDFSESLYHITMILQDHETKLNWNGLFNRRNCHYC